MKELSFNDFEVELMKDIRKWRDELIQHEPSLTLQDLDAGDAVKLASAIAEWIGLAGGVEIIGALETKRRLNDGWQD